MERNDRKLFYGWYVVVVCFLMTFVALGLGNSPKGQYIAPITGELGFERGMFTLTFSIREIVKAGCNLFFGVFALRFGPRKLAAAGFGCLAVCFLIFSLSSSLSVFYLAGVLMGIGVTFTSTATVSALVGNWFVEHKGTIMGVIFAGSGLGGSLFNLITANWIDSFGWRTAYLITGIIMAVMIIPLLVVVRDRPEEKGLTALGAGGTAQVKKRKTLNWQGYDFKTLLKQPYFYLGCAGAFFFGFLTNPVMTTVNAHLENVGFDPVFAAEVASVLALIMAAAKVLCGVIYDRWGLTVSMVVCFGATSAGCLLLAYSQSSWMAMAFAVVFAFSLPLETIMIPLVVSDLFGQRSYTRVVGIFLALMSLGIAIGSPVIQFYYDRTASYIGILVIFAAISALVLAGLLWCSSAARKVREAELQQ